MFKKFIKKYGYYFVAAALVFVIGLSAGLVSNDEGGNIDNSAQVGTTAIEMVCPMNKPEVLKWYSDTNLFYNSTLKQWESHKAIDLTSSVGNDVYAVLDGVVVDCSYSYENGYCLSISHDDGLVSNYCSLSNVDGIKKGDNVVRGQKIAEASNTAANEISYGNHLHFSISLNGKSVDPSNYITFENK